MSQTSTVQPPDIVSAIAESIATAIGNGATHKRNPVLLQLASDPLAVLAAHGLSADYFARALPDQLAAYVSMLKNHAQAEMNQTHKRGDENSPGFFACWACRIGFGAIVVGLGAVITVATLGEGTVGYTAIIIWVAKFVATRAIAASIVAGASAAVGSSVLGAFGVLIEFICQAIPDTCERS